MYKLNNCVQWKFYQGFQHRTLQFLSYFLQDMTLPILQTDNLAHIYPDVSQELCNKHAKQLSSLKTLFGEIYDDMQPEGFVVINGVAKVIDLGADLQLDFALENGVTILYSKTYKNEGIFINGNHVEEQIEFNSKGRHEDGIHQKIEQIKTAIKSIRKHAPSSKQFYGGILYIHSNIPEGQLAYNQCFMVGMALGLLLIHEELGSYSRKKLMELIMHCDDKLSQRTLTSLLSKYEINKIMIELYIQSRPDTEGDFDLTLHHPKSDRSIGTIESNQAIKNNEKRQETFRQPKSRESIECAECPSEIYRQQLTHLNIRLKENHKLIFCQIDLSQSQELQYSTKMEKIATISALLKEMKVHRSELFNEKGQLTLPVCLNGLIQKEDYPLLEYCQEVRCLMVGLVRGRLEFEDFILQKHKLDIEYQLHDEGVIQLLQQVCSEIKCLENFCIVEGRTLLISMEKNYYAEVMVFMRRLLNEYKFSTHKFLETFKKMQAQEKNTDIAEVMFTSMPSKGCAIYLPNQEEELWL